LRGGGYICPLALWAIESIDFEEDGNRKIQGKNAQWVGEVADIGMLADSLEKNTKNVTVKSGDEHTDIETVKKIEIKNNLINSLIESI
jgi:hypothetical protein